MRGITVRILSKRFSPVAMEAALNAFLDAQRTALQASLTDEVVQQRCQAIIRSLEDPPTTYSEEASDYWDSIVHDMPFDWTARVVAELRKLDRDSVLRRAEDWLFNAATRRSVSLMIFSPEHEQERKQLEERAAADAGHALAGMGGHLHTKRCFSVDDMTGLRDSLPLAEDNKGPV
jgi:secreted Zn-dependent insulinase-like peptidase